MPPERAREQAPHKAAPVPEKPKELQRTEMPRPDEQASEWDVVDEQAWESFPASDPPGRSSITGAEDAPDEPTERDEASKLPAARGNVRKGDDRKQR